MKKNAGQWIKISSKFSVCLSMHAAAVPIDTDSFLATVMRDWYKKVFLHMADYLSRLFFCLLAAWMQAAVQLARSSSPVFYVFVSIHACLSVSLATMCAAVALAAMLALSIWHALG